jgi:hypothetical protein
MTRCRVPEHGILRERREKIYGYRGRWEVGEVGGGRGERERGQTREAKPSSEGPNE